MEDSLVFIHKGRRKTKMENPKKKKGIDHLSIPNHIKNDRSRGI